MATAAISNVINDTKRYELRSSKGLTMNSINITILCQSHFSGYSVAIAFFSLVATAVFAQENEKKERPPETFLGAPVNPDAVYIPSYFDAAYSVIQKPRIAYELPAIEYLKEHAPENLGKYILSEDAWDRISILSLLKSDRDEAVHAILPYLEMRTPYDADADSDYYLNQRGCTGTTRRNVVFMRRDRNLDTEHASPETCVRVE